MDENLDFANFYHIYPPLAIHGWKAMDLSFNLAPSYRDWKDPISRQNFDGGTETCHLSETLSYMLYRRHKFTGDGSDILCIALRIMHGRHKLEPTTQIGTTNSNKRYIHKLELQTVVRQWSNIVLY